eukprot:FR742165.1.p1 GENE.FR742165.1~~FR742165.1.p1  ORF type:complete len:194 (+),score=12.61 FR742165.1:64-582(+)
MGTTSCNSSFWCNTFCGESCAESEGGICFYQKLSDLKDTCEKVDEIRRSDDYDPSNDYSDSTPAPSPVPGINLPPLPEMDAQMDEASPALDTGGRRDGSWYHDDLMDKGCGRHTYCQNCWGYCKESKMMLHLEAEYGLSGGYSPNTMKETLQNIVATCHYFGFSTVHQEISS